MKLPIRILILMGALNVSPLVSFAHEGHDHATPGAVKSPNGGVLQPGKNADVEMRQIGNKIEVFVLDEKSKKISPAAIQLTAEIAAFRSKKYDSLIFRAGKESFVAEKDLSSHRYELKLKMTYQNQTSDLIFQVEPQ